MVFPNNRNNTSVLFTLQIWGAGLPIHGSIFGKHLVYIKCAPADIWQNNASHLHREKKYVKLKTMKKCYEKYVTLCLQDHF